MEVRPKIKLQLTKGDKALETLCLIVLIILWGGTIAGYPGLPEQIPTHFNAAGEADDYGSKNSIFILPIVATLVYIGMSVLNQYPHIYNYPTTVTEKNARRLYTSVTKLMRTLKLIVTVIFAGIVYMTYRSVFMNNDGLGRWFLPTVLGLLLLPVIIFLVRSNDADQSIAELDAD